MTIKALSSTKIGVVDPVTGIITVPVPTPPIASGTFAPPAGEIGVAYSYDASVLFTGGTPDSYSLATGTLPDGLSLNTSTCVISGTPTTDETQTGISVTGTNVYGSATTNTAEIDVTDPAEIAPIASGTFAPPNGVISSAYSYATAVLFTGGAPTSYSLATGTLPSGLSLNTSTGLISGTPTTEETQAGVSITGTNATGSDTTNTASMTVLDNAGTDSVVMTVATADVPPASLVYGRTVAINDVLGYSTNAPKDGGGNGTLSVDSLGVPTITDNGDSVTTYGNHLVTFDYDGGASETEYVVNGDIAQIEAHFTAYPKDAAGNTVLTPSATARLIYVDDTGGDDFAAGPSGNSTVMYTLSDLPNMGDWENPGAVKAYKSADAARLKVNSGAGDWVLFKRGEEFVVDKPMYVRSGASALLPTVYGAYGTGARPHINPDVTHSDGITFSMADQNYVAIIGLLCYPTFYDPNHADWIGWTVKDPAPKFFKYFSGSVQQGLLITDCECKYYPGNVTIASGMTDVTIRRNKFGYSNNEEGEAGSMFLSKTSALVEDNQIIHTGWYQQSMPITAVADSGTAIDYGGTETGTVTVSPDPGWGIDQWATATIDIATSGWDSSAAVITHDGKIVSNTSDTITFETRYFPASPPHKQYPDCDFTGGGQQFIIGRYQETRLGMASGKSQAIYHVYGRDSIIRNNNFVSNCAFGYKNTSNRYSIDDPGGVEPGSWNIAVYDNMFTDGIGGISIAGNTESGLGFRYKDMRVFNNAFSKIGEFDVTRQSLAWTLTLEDCEGGLVANNILAQIGHNRLPGPQVILGVNLAGHQKDVVASRNVLFDVGRETATHVPGNYDPPWTYGGPNPTADSTQNNHWIGNYVQQQNKSCLCIGRYFSGFGVNMAENKYFSNMAGTSWFDLDSTLVTAATFFAETGETDATLTLIPFVDDAVSLENYQTLLGGTATREAYGEDAWDKVWTTEWDDLSPEVVVKYFQAGFKEA
ncbi:MAG: hypothetical protein GY918_14875 [Gammaproteobacteria bacterium]|nr:hypothetical protein [Gammaproteobacteria bacterium]